MELDLTRLTAVTPWNPGHRYHLYKKTDNGIIGKTVEAVGRMKEHRPGYAPGREITIILFTDETYFPCEIWCE